MRPATLMIQGTGSDSGKSTVVAGLCRLALRRGLSVIPFKPQNMSNNAAVCPDGGEIGRAQALQARAAGRHPTVDMNPVLLKPQSDRGAQLVVHGQAVGEQDATAYRADRSRLLVPVLDSFERIAANADLVIVEGAGSAAEDRARCGRHLCPERTDDHGLRDPHGYDDGTRRPYPPLCSRRRTDGWRH